MSDAFEPARPKAVLDTNVLVSMVIKPDGLCGRLRDPLVRGDFTMVTSEELLGELEDVLGRPKMRRYISNPDARRYIAVLRKLAEIRASIFEDVDLVPRDVKDNPFVACALEADVGLLVTGDHKHLLALGTVRVSGYRPVRMVTARAFLKEIRGTGR